LFQAESQTACCDQNWRLVGKLTDLRERMKLK